MELNKNGVRGLLRANISYEALVEGLRKYGKKVNEVVSFYDRSEEKGKDGNYDYSSVYIRTKEKHFSVPLHRYIKEFKVISVYKAHLYYGDIESKKSDKLVMEYNDELYLFDDRITKFYANGKFRWCWLANDEFMRERLVNRMSDIFIGGIWSCSGELCNRYSLEYVLSNIPKEYHSALKKFWGFRPIYKRLTKDGELQGFVVYIGDFSASFSLDLAKEMFMSVFIEREGIESVEIDKDTKMFDLSDLIEPNDELDKCIIYILNNLSTTQEETVVWLFARILCGEIEIGDKELLECIKTFARAFLIFNETHYSHNCEVCLIDRDALLEAFGAHKTGDK